MKAAGLTPVRQATPRTSSLPASRSWTAAQLPRTTLDDVASWGSSRSSGKYLPIVAVERSGILYASGPVQVEAFRELIRLEHSEIRRFSSVIAESRWIDLQPVEYISLRSGLPIWHSGCRSFNESRCVCVFRSHPGTDSGGTTGTDSEMTRALNPERFGH